jgi:hypothetical protein
MLLLTVLLHGERGGGGRVLLQCYLRVGNTLLLNNWSQSSCKPVLNGRSQLDRWPLPSYNRNWIQREFGFNCSMTTLCPVSTKIIFLGTVPTIDSPQKKRTLSSVTLLVPDISDCPKSLCQSQRRGDGELLFKLKTRYDLIAIYL